MRIGFVSNVKVLAGAAGLLLALVLVMCLVLPALAVPGLSERFCGTVTVNGSPADAGTVISARIGGVEFGTGTVDSNGRYGNCSTTGCFYVSADDPDTTPLKEGGVEGDTVQFYIGGVLLGGSIVFQNGAITPLNLSATGALEYVLTVSTTAGGNVTLPGLGNFTYPAGGNVTLVAVADTDFHFGNWTGNVSTVGNVTASETYVIMNGNYNITANFAADTAPTPTPVVTPTPTPTGPTPTATPVQTVSPILTPSPTIAPTTPTIAPTPPKTVAPTPTPTTAGGGTNIGVIIGPIIAVIVIGAVAFWFWRGRKPKTPGPTT